MSKVESPHWRSHRPL